MDIAETAVAQALHPPHPERSSLEMVTLVKQVRQDGAGFVRKQCVMCLMTRPHAVALSWTEVAGFTRERKIALTCSACGLEREVEGDAAMLLTASAVSREELVETPPLGPSRPVGTEWLVVDQAPLLLPEVARH
jgi:hypothetical protein